jgi:hypothetical protein
MWGACVAAPAPEPAPPAPVAPAPSPPGLRPGFDPAQYVNQGNRYNCPDFQSQAEAQAVLRADPRDPNQLDSTGPGCSPVSFGGSPFWPRSLLPPLPIPATTDPSALRSSDQHLPYGDLGGPYDGMKLGM